MVNRQARLVEFFFFTCFSIVISYDRIKNKIWLVRYYFKVNLGTVLVG